MTDVRDTNSNVSAELMRRINAAKEAPDLVDIAAAYLVDDDALAAFKARAEALQLDEVDWGQIYWVSSSESELELFAKKKGKVKN